MIRMWKTSLLTFLYVLEGDWLIFLLYIVLFRERPIQFAIVSKFAIVLSWAWEASFILIFLGVCVRPVQIAIVLFCRRAGYLAGVRGKCSQVMLRQEPRWLLMIMMLLMIRMSGLERIIAEGARGGGPRPSLLRLARANPLALLPAILRIIDVRIVCSIP